MLERCGVTVTSFPTTLPLSPSTLSRPPHCCSGLQHLLPQDICIDYFLCHEYFSTDICKISPLVYFKVLLKYLLNEANLFHTI